MPVAAKPSAGPQVGVSRLRVTACLTRLSHWVGIHRGASGWGEASFGFAVRTGSALVRPTVNAVRRSVVGPDLGGLRRRPRMLEEPNHLTVGTEHQRYRKPLVDPAAEKLERLHRQHCRVVLSHRLRLVGARCGAGRLIVRGVVVAHELGPCHGP